MTATASNRPLAFYLEGKDLNKVERNKAARDGLDLAGDLERFAQAGWQAIDETDLQLRLKWFGLFWRPVTPGQFMLRLRVPNGVINAEQLKAVASIVARYGSQGSCDITTRQNLQLRGVLLEDFPDILDRVKQVGLTSIQSGFDNPRNVTGNPLAGIDPLEIVDTRPYAQALQDFLVNSGAGNRSFSNLPRKWNTAVAGAKDNFLLHNDIVFHPVERDGVMGFSVWVGGILSSRMNAYALPLNAWIPPEEICRIADAVIGLWRDHGERKNRPKGRFRFYLDSLGIDAFRELLVERFGPLAEAPGSVFDATPRKHLGLHPQKQDGHFYAGLHVPVGRLRTVDLQDLASVSERLGDGEVRLTEDQNVILSGIAASQANALATEPLLQRFPMEPGAVAAGTVSCTGNTYCGFALTNTKDTALTVAKELDQELELPEEVRIHWTGCPNSCGQAYMGAIGLTGTKAKAPDGRLGEGYDITIGGSQGANPQIGSKSRAKVPAAEVKQVVRDLLIEHYGARLRAS